MLLITGPALPFMNDDTYGLNPAVRARFAPGEYNVHIGVWQGSQSVVPYTFHLRSGDDEPLGEEWHGEGAYIPTGAPNLEAEPALGTLVLGQHEGARRLSANQEADFRTTLDCYGYFALEQPLVVIDPRDLVDSGARVVLAGDRGNGVTVDTLLIGIEADGSVFCVDDFEGENAGFDILNPERGAVKIFAGTWLPNAEGASVGFVLTVTEIDR